MIRLVPGRMDVACICVRRPCKHERTEEARWLAAKVDADRINAPTDDDGCQPDCAATDLRQVASDEAECVVCGYRRPLGDD